MMELRVKSIRQDMSYEDGDVTNVLILVAPSGEEILAIVSDESVRRLIELRVSPHSPPPPQAVLPFRESIPGPHEATLEFTQVTGGAYDDETVAVFGGGDFDQTDEEPLPEPPPPVQVQQGGKSVSQQLQELKGKGVRKDPQRNAMHGRTVPKDEYGYPVVTGLQKAPLPTREGDEDGIGQA